MKKLFIIAIKAVLFSSCATVYIPNSVNAPLFKKERQTSISGNYGYSGAGIQGAHSVTSNLFFLANGNYHGLLDSQSIVYFGEIGTGYFYNFKDNRVFEISAGGGMGSVNSSSSSDITNFCIWGCPPESKYSGNYYRAFIQPSVGISGENAEVGLSLRNSYVIFPKFIEKVGIYENEKAYFNQENYFFEPVFFFLAGGTRLKILYQAGLSLPYNNKPFSPPQTKMFVSVGLNLTLGNIE